MRIARDCGDVSAILPDGISLADAPHDLVDSISSALVFLSFEEHAPEDRPPKRIWLQPEKLKAHWAAVRKRWKDGSTGDQAIEDPVENAAAEGLIVGIT